MFSKQYAEQWIRDNTIIHCTLSGLKEVVEFDMLLYKAGLIKLTSYRLKAH